MGEFELINNYFRARAEQLLPRYPAIETGIGDDCALINVPTETLAVSCDTLLADVHFLASANARDIATRALSVAISDLAAMGAQPLGFSLALSLEQADKSWMRAFSEGLFAAAEKYSVPLLGGDTTRGHLSLTIQVLGTVPAGNALLRSNASVGEQVFCSGSLGDGAAALHLLQQGRLAEHETLSRHYYFPDVACSLALGRDIRGLAGAAIDISDGLCADLQHIADASAVGIELYCEQLPIAEHVQRLAETSGLPAVDWALAGGDDYRLCFTMASEHAAALQQQGLVMHHIGRVTADTGLRCLDADGKLYTVNKSGYQHFE